LLRRLLAVHEIIKIVFLRVALVSRLEEEPHVNPNTGTTESSLRDLDGYYVTISTLDPA
jgi:hypothetical protein